MKIVPFASTQFCTKFANFSDGVRWQDLTRSIITLESDSFLALLFLALKPHHIKPETWHDKALNVWIKSMNNYYLNENVIPETMAKITSIKEDQWLAWSLPLWDHSLRGIQFHLKWLILSRFRTPSKMQMGTRSKVSDLHNVMVGQIPSGTPTAELDITMYTI